MAIGVSWDQPPRQLSEDDLLDGYRNTSGSLVLVAARCEPCACGGTVAATIDTPQQITAAVVAHQQTSRHRAWWTWMEASR